MRIDGFGTSPLQLIAAVFDKQLGTSWVPYEYSYSYVMLDVRFEVGFAVIAGLLLASRLDYQPRALEAGSRETAVTVSYWYEYQYISYGEGNALPPVSAV